ncbi:MAG: hypothetical protein R8J41_11150 [Alphaproteobacteria bacterium]|nr:hypothetical protein [Alphaproteobacteria bacterium]
MTDAHTVRIPTIPTVGHALSVFLLLTYLICIGFGLLVPGEARMYEAWAPLLPGFEWLTVSGFVFGAIGAYAYGWYIALFLMPIYRFFEKRS